MRAHSEHRGREQQQRREPVRGHDVRERDHDLASAAAAPASCPSAAAVMFGITFTSRTPATPALNTSISTGIDHRVDQLVAQPHPALDVLGEPLQHRRERARRLARAHHRAVELVEHVREAGRARRRARCPRSRDSRTRPITVLKRSLSTCSVSAASAWTSGMPAATSVASWLENIARSRSRDARAAAGAAACAAARTPRCATLPSRISVGKMPSARSFARAERGLSASIEAATARFPAATPL